MKTSGSLSILVPKVLTSASPCMNSPIIGPLQLVISVVKNCHAEELGFTRVSIPTYSCRRLLALSPKRAPLEGQG